MTCQKDGFVCGISQIFIGEAVKIYFQLFSIDLFDLVSPIFRQTHNRFPTSNKTLTCWTRLGRHSRDPRPVGDRAFTAQCAKNVVELLTARGPQTWPAMWPWGCTWGTCGNCQNWGIPSIFGAHVGVPKLYKMLNKVKWGVSI